jgi:hypothetical protein
MISAMSFPILSFEQNNPGLVRQNYLNSLINQGLSNYQLAQQARYAPEMAQADLQKKLADIAGTQAQTGLVGQETQWYGPKAQSEIGLQGAQAGYYGAEGNRIRQMTPYDVLKAKMGVYSDPILQRLQELQLAQQGGQTGISPDLLSQAGFGQSNQNQIPSQNTAQTLNLGNQTGQVIPQGSVAQTLGLGNQASPMTAPRMFAGNNPMQNWALTGSPLSPIQQMQLKAMGEGMNTAAKTGVIEYNNALNAASSSGEDATQMKNLVDQFKDAYNRSKYTGPIQGIVPSSLANAQGVTGKTAFAAANLVDMGHDFTPEQQADNAAQNMQQMVLKLMKTNRLTNYELQFAGNLKLNRNMTPETIKTVGDWLSAKSNRLNEQQQFLTAAKNTGIDIQTANALWNKYENQRPAYDFVNHKTNTQYQDAWKDYLTPQAINSVQSGRPFVPNRERLSNHDLRYLSPQELLSLRNVNSQ